MTVAAQSRQRAVFIVGMVFGWIAQAGGRYAINNSALPDRLVAPLMLTDTSADADAIVALGAGVIGECTPNMNGVRRVAQAVRLFKTGRAPLLAFTGGPTDGSCPVAEAMASLAVDLGVPRERILIEREARSTRENATNVWQLLTATGKHRVLLVTDALHMRRAASAFGAVGLEPGRSSVPVYQGHRDNVDMLLSGLRETVALAYYRWNGWLSPATLPVNSTESNPVSHPPRPTDLAHPGGPIVVLGASYAGSWKIADVAGVPVINKGVAGQVSADLLARFDDDVVAAEPRAVLIWGFINDVFRADPAAVEHSLNGIRATYEELLERALASHIDPILVTEVTIRGNDSWLEGLARLVGRLRGRESYQDRINRHVLATNRWLGDVARRKGLMLLDFHQVLADADGSRRREFIQEDGSHITPAGYAALTAYAVPRLEARHGQR